MPGTVLLAEHDPAVREMLHRYLARDGLAVCPAGTPGQTLAALAAPPPRRLVAVLDLTMPELDPRRLRQALGSHPALPAVFLVAPGPRPRGLAAAQAPGARRWLTRPFGPRQLTGTVHELLRPARAADAAADGHRIEFAGRDIRLTATEYAFLAALRATPGRPCSRAQLLAAAGRDAAERSVDVHIAQLRAKLGDPDLIRTVRGVGFALTRNPGPAASPDGSAEGVVAGPAG